MLAPRIALCLVSVHHSNPGFPRHWKHVHGSAHVVNGKEIRVFRDFRFVVLTTGNPDVEVCVVDFTLPKSTDLNLRLRNCSE